MCGVDREVKANGEGREGGLEDAGSFEIMRL